MSFIEIILPDNSVKKFDHEPSVLEVAQTISPRLAEATLGGFVSLNGSPGEVVDLRAKLKSQSKLEIITDKHKLANEVVRHSAAHIMAQAVQEIWPDVKVTIGPVVESGFYYDFDSPRPFSPDDLGKIETRMQEIVKRDLPITREEWPVQKAIDTFTKMKENFKVEIIKDLQAKGENVVSVYHQGEWFDLCRGPHVQKTGAVKAVKVLSLAGAYWRGDEKNPQLQRVYGTAFCSKKDLDHHMVLLEEASKRDHRKLGRELDLFHTHQWAPGSPLFTSKGSIVYNQLIEYVREKYFEYGYSEVITPQIYDTELYKTSGHMEHYKENMYFTKVDERDFSMKPMNCPGHCLLYSLDHRSYRDLPWRVADFGRLHRYERSGTMHGITRVRSFCQDDAHIFCTTAQIEAEVAGFMKLFGEIYKTLGMTDYQVFLSTRPAQKLGSDEVWDKAEAALENALKHMGVSYKINPGDGAFYGPKLDFLFRDAIERTWQLGTCQLDFQLPERFKLKYVGEDNSEHRPVMIHRAVLGSLERFIGVYIEHCAGKFPTWLSPEQVRVITVSEKFSEHGQKIEAEIRKKKIRAVFDTRNEKLGYKIRDAQLKQIPYMVVIGEKEIANNVVSVRLRNGKSIENMSFDSFLETLDKDIKSRCLESPLAT
jgi:threonyl-tRNA synthetase